MLRQVIKLLLEDIDQVTKIDIFDFDGSLMVTPEPEGGKKEYEEKTGNKWPHRGWWREAESLKEPLDIKPVPWVLEDFKESISDPTTYTVIMTGREEHLKKEVQYLLDKYEIKPQELILKTPHPYLDYEATEDFKTRKIKKLAKKLPNTSQVEMWEDRVKHIPIFKDYVTDELGLKVKINRV